MTAIERILETARNEVGYLEKADGNNLYSKTDNAGYNNYTKYGYEMHQIYPATMDYPAAWCDAFFDWLMVKTFGETVAEKMLHGFDDYTVASADKYKSNGEWHTTPKEGDQIFFKNSSGICHTGIVTLVSGAKVYTIEGNTSSASGVVANGGCVAKKSYDLDYSRIAGYGRPNYELAESEDEMTDAEKEKMKAIDESLTNLYRIVTEVKQEIISLKKKSTPVIYDYMDKNMPAWAKPTIQKMMDKGLLKGDENGKLGLTDELLRVFVTNDRAGLYDHLWDGESV